MRTFVIALLSGCLLVPAIAAEKAAFAEEKQEEAVPNQDTLTPARKMEIAANMAFENKDYIQALAIYRKLEQQYKGEPTKLDPIQERIRVCMANIEKSMVPGASAQGGVAAATPSEETSPEKRKPHVKPKKETDVYELSIKALGNFEYDSEKGGNVPEDVKKLEGTKIRTRGFMIPLDQADNITQFVLVPDLFACCFGQAPQVQHTVVVSTPKGKAVGYYPDEIVVEGTLSVEEKKEDGIIVSLFEVACTSVKPAAK